MLDKVFSPRSFLFSLYINDSYRSKKKKKKKVTNRMFKKEIKILLDILNYMHILSDSFPLTPYSSLLFFSVTKMLFLFVFVFCFE